MYLKSLSLVTCKVPHASMVVAEGTKFFEFNISALLEKALKALSTQIEFEQAFAFCPFAFYSFQGAAGYIIVHFIPCFSFMLYSLFEKS